jgi:chromosome segregation ATPase
MENGREIRSWSAHGGILSIDMARDGRLATGGRDRLARVWDGNGQQLAQAGPLDDLATGVALGHDSTRLLVGGWTGELRVYDAASATLIGTLATNPMTMVQRESIEARDSLERIRTEAAQLKAAAEAIGIELAGRAASLASAREAVRLAEQEQQAALAVRQERQVIADGASAEAEKARAAVQAVQTPREELRVSVEAARAAAKTAADDMQAALREALAAGPDQRPAAERLLEGATAVAQLAASKLAILEVDLARRTVECDHWRSLAAPVIQRAETLVAQWREAEDLVAAKEIALAQARQQLEASGSAVAQLGPTAESATRQHNEALQRLAAAEQRCQEAAARWAAQRQALEASGGRVP